MTHSGDQPDELANYDDYERESYQLLYKTWYQERVSVRYLKRLQAFDTVSSVLSVLTASGSAVAGWTLWTLEPARLFWVALAALAAVIALVHGALQIRSRTKIQEQLRLEFAGLRVLIQSFRQRLQIHKVTGDTAGQYEQLLSRSEQIVPKAESDILITKAIERAAQDDVDRLLASERAPIRAEVFLSTAGGDVIIGADIVLSGQGEVQGKPISDDDAT